jgi:hypothetical protein
MSFFSKILGKKKQEQEEPPYPSWGPNKEKMQEFAFKLKEKMRNKNIPEKFLYGLMENEYSQNKLLFTAGLMEKHHGASFDEQTDAVFNQIEKYWLQMENKENWYK